MPVDYSVPEDVLYTREHEWAKVINDNVRIGITDYAAKTLNDIVYVSIPPMGQKVRQGASFGTVESIKAVSELYSPFSGTVTRTNGELSNHPELVNKSPYEEGWILEINPSNLDEEKDKLLGWKEYREFLRSLGK